jgi:hypothetical protein
MAAISRSAVRLDTRAVVSVRRTERDGAELAESSAVFVSSDTVVTGHRLAVNQQLPALMPALRVRVGEAVHAATVTGYSQSWRLVALSARDLRGEPAEGRPSRTLQLGEPVTVVAAAGEELRAIDGEIVRLSLARGRHPYERHYQIETSVPSWPQSAGAGLFDVRGHIIGVCADETEDGRIVAAPADWLIVGTAKHVARALLGNAVFRDAVSELRWLVEKGGQSGDPEVWAMLAVCYEGLGRRDERKVALRRVCELDPDSAWAAHALGAELLGSRIHRAEAVTWLSRAVALEPWNARYRTSLDAAQR